MYDEQALENFKQTVVLPWHHAALLKMEQDYRRLREQWAAHFIEHFRRFCHRILDGQRSGDKGEIGYITYSLLRTGLMDGQPAYVAEAFDERWFFDRQPVQMEYDPKWAFQPLKGLEKQWEPAARMYVGKIPMPLLEKLKLAETVHFHSYVTELIRYAMPQAVQLPEFQDLAKSPVFELRVGEYMDHSVTVYKEDKRELDSTVVREWLGDRLEGEYAYQGVEGADLSGGDYPGLDFRYTAFRQCNLSFARLSFGMLVGTHWRNCLLEGADFSFSALHGSDFRGCRLPNSVFTGIRGGGPTEEAGVEWIMPGFGGMCFAEADVSGADFRYADLRGADFRAADLRGANLREADLREADFSEGNLFNADFTGANLRDTNFIGADLREANFTGSDLREVDFTGAKLTGAVLEGADLAGAMLPEGPWSTLLKEVGR
ncbi:pentapeptide repeat-containing protein [Paenibacillus medicaginis]|uniref:Pentapeptide repeat-containing protein n=1 Tax=Paenibacillus medicaginis TaxID=1470560 RepID=A0ABV5CC40_9BACL